MVLSILTSSVITEVYVDATSWSLDTVDPESDLEVTAGWIMLSEFPGFLWLPQFVVGTVVAAFLRT